MTYLFDVKLFGSIPIHADDEPSARRILGRMMEGIDFGGHDISLDDASGPTLIEIDGRDV